MTVSSVSLPPQLGLPPHAHDSAQLCVVLEGRYQESTHGRSVPLSAGSVLWRPAGAVHANRVGMHAVHALLVDLEADRARQMGFVPKPAYFGPGTFDEVCRELGRELRAADEHTHVALEALVLLLGARAGRYTRRGQKQRPPWFARALEFVHASYTEPIAVSDVARAAGVHPVTLASAFRLHLGRSTAQYILDLRVDHARRELLGSREPVAAIAGRAGFYDESHLGRVFRRRFGRSPGSMRRGD